MGVFASGSPSFAVPVSARADEPVAIVVQPGFGVELRGRKLRFGAMPQDVFSDLGPPEQVCVKDVDTVRIHSSRAMPTCSPGPDYYYNYYNLGLDVLFDGCSHLVKKVILHTNPPTHELFTRYTRCFYQIPINVPRDRLQSSDLGQCKNPAGSPGSPESISIHWHEAGDLVEMQEFCIEAALEADIEDDIAVGVDVESEKPNSEWCAKDTLSEERPKIAGKVKHEPRAEVGAAVPSDGSAKCDHAEERCTSGRRMSKRERKVARKKNRGREGPASPGMHSADDFPADIQLQAPDTSPDLSVISSTSPTPSPILATLCAMSVNGEAPLESCNIEAQGEASCFDELPPPAVPFDLPEGDAVLGAEDGFELTGGHINLKCFYTGQHGDQDCDETGVAVEETPFATSQGGTRQASAATLSGAQPGNSATATKNKPDAPGLFVPDSEAGNSRAVLNDANTQHAAPSGSTATVTIDVRWPWSSIQEVLGRCAGCGCGKPLVVNQGSHAPFGSTFFYAFPGLVFEVMQNGNVASLTVFSVPHGELPFVFQSPLVQPGESPPQ